MTFLYVPYTFLYVPRRDLALTKETPPRWSAWCYSWRPSFSYQGGRQDAGWKPGVAHLDQGIQVMQNWNARLITFSYVLQYVLMRSPMPCSTYTNTYHTFLYVPTTFSCVPTWFWTPRSLCPIRSYTFYIRSYTFYQHLCETRSTNTTKTNK